ncbi:hypothetical protein, partial [Salmonella phage vB_SalS_TU03]
LFKSGSLLSR